MKILELQILTDNIKQTEHFYHEIMGLELQYADHSLLKFSAGFSVLTFRRSYNKLPVYHFAFNIPSNKFEEALQWAIPKFEMIRLGPHEYVADFRSWNAKAFYFFDNNRNIVECIARFDLDNSTLKPFNGSAIVSISEIGMVVDNPAHYSKELLQQYRLGFFSRQVPTENFMAVGNDDGLFIVVPENRAWYPTNILSKQFRTEVTIEHDNRLSRVILHKK